MAEAERDRRRTSVFTIVLIASMAALMILREALGSRIDLSRGTTVVTLQLMLAAGVVLVGAIRALDQPLSSHGITLEGWRASLRDGLLASLPLIALATALAWTSLGDEGGPLLDPLDTRGPGVSLARFLALNVAYVGVVVPLQELMVRGLLQGQLVRIIQSRHRTVLAIVLSNLLYATGHLFLSTWLAIVTFVMGVILGWVYARTRSLVGVCVAHALVGVWALTIVRIQSMLL